MQINIRKAEEKDYPFILRVNEENVEVLSPMGEDRIREFSKWPCGLHRTCGSNPSCAAKMISSLELQSGSAVVAHAVRPGRWPL